MRKMILALAVVLLAAPAWATVEIVLTDLGGGVIQIGYDASDESPKLVRAFALDIVATGGNIIAIDDYSRGDDNGGYGIFPGSFAGNISVNTTTGDVDNWDGNPNPYTPVAPAGDPEAKGDIPGPEITIEMGSLYSDPDMKPGEEGVLCTITVDPNVTKVCVTGNAIRGNVVLEDASEATLTPAEVCIEVGEPPCFPESDPHYQDWLDFGSPDCWCYARQCHGDADGLKQGSAFAGYMYVFTNDLAVLVSAWQVKEPPKASVQYPNGIIDVPNGICADFDHNQQGSAFAGYMRVFTNDLGILVKAWQAKEPPKNNPAHAYYPNGIPGDCVPVPVEP